jgi:hypothetical protein
VPSSIKNPAFAVALRKVSAQPPAITGQGKRHKFLSPTEFYTQNFNQLNLAKQAKAIVEANAPFPQPFSRRRYKISVPISANRAEKIPRYFLRN